MRNHANRLARIEGIVSRWPTKQQLASELTHYISAIYGSSSAMAATVAGIYGSDVDSIRAIIETHMGADHAQL